MINMYKEIDQTPYKQEINTKNLIQCWKECMATSSYTLRKAAVEKFNSENYWKKKGLVMIPPEVSCWPWSSCFWSGQFFKQTNPKALRKLSMKVDMVVLSSC